MAKIRLEGLRKEFRSGKRHLCAVRDIDLEIEDGEFMALVGPSGCGKTTTLRMIAGLEKPTSGNIFIGNENVVDKPPQERNLSMVFQHVALYPHMTAFQNITYPLKIKRRSKNEMEEKAKKTADLLQITELLNSYPNELSGGQQQRVALGRAIVIKPQAFLLDEPMAALDAKLKYQIIKELHLVHKEIGMTMLYVTHDQEEAMTSADRIGVMRDGEVQQVGTPEEIYDNPINIFCATFFGHPEINLLEVRNLGYEGENLNVAAGSIFSIKLPISIFSGVVNNVDSLFLGIRPSVVQIVKPADGMFGGRIKLLEPVGDRRIIYIDTQFGEMRSVVTYEDENIKEGNDIGINFQSKDVHIFDANTGKSCRY